MGEKEKNAHLTEHRGYPKPHEDHFLQDDVKNLEKSLDSIDGDVNELYNTVKTKADKKSTDKSVKDLLATDNKHTDELANLKKVKADKSEVESKFKSIDSEIGSKTPKTEFSNRVISVDKSLATKATKSELNSGISNLKQTLASKDNLLGIQILPGTKPFLYCRMRRSGRGYLGYPWTSNYSLYANNSSARFMFEQLVGYRNSSSYDCFAIPPSMHFSGNGGTWMKNEGWTEYAYTSNQYNYPSYDMLVMFVKNTTNSDMTRTFGRYLSSNNSNGSYNRSSVYVGTPNYQNQSKGSINSIGWSNVYNYSSNTYATNANFNVTIPRGKTVAILMYSTAYFYTSGSSHYMFYSTIGFYNLNSFLCDGLEIDRERTLKAYQRNCCNIHEIWH